MEVRVQIKERLKVWNLYESVIDYDMASKTDRREKINSWLYSFIRCIEVGKFNEKDQFNFEQAEFDRSILCVFMIKRKF